MGKLHNTHLTKKKTQMTNENMHMWTLVVESIFCTPGHLSQRSEKLDLYVNGQTGFTCNDQGL